MTKENYNNLENKAYEHYIMANLAFDISNEKDNIDDTTLYNASILNAYTCLHQICSYFAWKNDIDIEKAIRNPSKRKKGHHEKLIEAVNLYLKENDSNFEDEYKKFYYDLNELRKIRNQVFYSNRVYLKNDCKKLLNTMEKLYNYIRGKL